MRIVRCDTVKISRVFFSYSRNGRHDFGGNASRVYLHQANGDQPIFTRTYNSKKKENFGEDFSLKVYSGCALPAIYALRRKRKQILESCFLFIFIHSFVAAVVVVAFFPFFFFLLVCSPPSSLLHVLHYV